MNNKGFADSNNIVETPKGGDIAGKPSKSNPVTPNRVDINVLKARVQEAQNKESKKNFTIFAFFIALLGFLGIYLSA
jgi:hypothetical protein